MKYQILDHKTDLKIKVFGRTKKDLLRNAMLGMLKSARYESVTGGKESKLVIKIESIDFSSLLIDFLNEILYLVETKKLIFKKIKFKKFSENEVEAILVGKKLKRLGLHIKGATHHDLRVYQGKNKKWQAIILFDV